GGGGESRDPGLTRRGRRGSRQVGAKVSATNAGATARSGSGRSPGFLGAPTCLQDRSYVDGRGPKVLVGRNPFVGSPERCASRPTHGGGTGASVLEDSAVCRVQEASEGRLGAVGPSKGVAE